MLIRCWVVCLESDVVTNLGAHFRDALHLYGNFDIILDHFPRISQLHPTPHALWSVFYLVPSLT